MNENKLPKLHSYGCYSSDNYGSHCMCVDIPASRKNKHGIILYFSYNTLVAFRGFINGECKFIAHTNVWGTTTGKHLNWLTSDKKARVDDNEFNKLYEQALRNA